VAAVAANDVWAVGWQQTNSVDKTLIEHWDGSAWSVVSSPNVGSYSVLNAVAAVAGNANDIWAVGYSDGPQTLVEHWNGISWSIVPSPGVGSLQSVSAVAANDIWAVGCSNYSCNSIGAQTLIEHWNGSTWSIVPGPNPGAGNNELDRVAAMAANDVWAVGTYYASGGPYHTLIEHWNGSSWSAVPSPPGGSLFGAVAANNIWAVGDLGNYSGGFIMHYNDPCAGTATPTATPALSNTLVGHVTWQGIPQPDPRNNGITGTLILCVSGSPQNYSVSTDANGYFTVSVGSLPNGTYNWRVKGPKYLANSGTLTLSGAPVTNVEMGLMLTGDCNNDNAVNVLDFGILKPTFGKSIGDPGYDDRADFNGDQTVNIADFNLLKGNFGQGGAVANCP